MLEDCPQLAFIVCRTDNKVVSNGAMLADIEQYNIVGLFVLRQFNCSPRKKSDIDDSRSSEFLKIQIFFDRTTDDALCKPEDAQMFKCSNVCRFLACIASPRQQQYNREHSLACKIF
jgi:hypothetical protein